MSEQPFSLKNPGQDASVPAQRMFLASFFQGSGLFSFVLVLFCLFINVYVRLFPAYFPQLRQEAALNVVNQIIGEGTEGILGPDVRVEAEYQKLKDRYQDPNGLTYLMEMDPYLWARYTKHIIQHGHPGDLKKEGENYDALMVAPLGLNLKQFYFQFLFYLSAYLYQGVHVFIPAVSADAFLFYVPVFYAALFFLLFYLFVRRWYGDFAAFIAVLCTGLSPNFIERSCAGWYDFDMLSLVMAVAVAWCFLEASVRRQKFWQVVCFSLAAGFFQGLFAFTWTGWWFIALVCLAFCVVSLFTDWLVHLKEKGKFQNCILPRIVSLMLFLGFALFWVLFFTGENALGQITILSRWLHFGTPVTGFAHDIWPNTFYSIAELHTLDWQGFLTFFPSKIFFALSAVAVFFVTIGHWNGKRRDAVILMLIWTILMGYAALKGQRFMLYFLPPFYFFLGAFLGDFLPALILRIRALLKQLFAGMFFFIVIFFLIWRSIVSGLDYAEKFYPLMNDAWHRALSYVDANTPRNAVLNSWWDYGNWLKYYGKRRVIFDNQSQLGQLCYWMSRALLETEETKAIADLRLMNNNSSRTYYELLNYIQDPFQCNHVLQNLLTLDRISGTRLLARYPIPPQEAEAILNKLHDQPAPAYLIVDRSLFRNMDAVSFFGNWDFQRLFLNQNAGKPGEETVRKMQDIWGMPPQHARRMYELAAINHGRFSDEALSRRVQFYGEPEEGVLHGDLLAFKNGFLFNLRTSEMLFYSRDNNRYLIPRKVVLYEGAEKKLFENSQGDYDKTLILIKQHEKYLCAIADDGLVDSLFLRLYLLGGEGLKHFRPFYQDENNHIFIYEILWETGS